MKLVLLQILAAISALASAAATAQKDETIITEMDITRVDEAVDFELDENAPLPYPEAPMEWTGEVVSGAGLVTLEGSLEEIGDQIREINPQYFETDHSNETIVEAADGLNKRQVGGCSPRGINVAVSCNTRFGTVRGRDISNGLSYLGQMGGCLTQQANRCGRISCSYNSAIYNCAAVSLLESSYTFVPKR